MPTQTGVHGSNVIWKSFTSICRFLRASFGRAGVHLGVSAPRTHPKATRSQRRFLSCSGWPPRNTAVAQAWIQVTSHGVTHRRGLSELPGWARLTGHYLAPPQLRLTFERVARPSTRDFSLQVRLNAAHRGCVSQRTSVIEPEAEKQMVEATVMRLSVMDEFGFVAPHNGSGDAFVPLSSGENSRGARSERQDGSLLNDLGAPTAQRGAGVESHRLASAIGVRSRYQVGPDSASRVSR